MIEIETDRLVLYPLSDKEMKKKIDTEPDEGMKIAYGEMLDGCKAHPKLRIWNAIWNMQLKECKNIIVGDFSFKGLNDGIVEIGYGIKPEYERKGYMTEAVTAVADWASRQPGVIRVEAETEEDNIASKRVLEKAGFIPNGVMGAEGPRYVKKNHDMGGGTASRLRNFLLENLMA